MNAQRKFTLDTGLVLAACVGGATYTVGFSVAAAATAMILVFATALLAVRLP